MSQIKIENLTFGYEGNADNVFENVSFEFDTDWKLGFTGRNGKGKTTFLNLLMGKYEYRGTISSPVGFDYFPFAVSEPGRESLGVLRRAAPDAEDWQIQRELSLLNVPEDVLERPFTTLSRGEQTKLLLAALFLRENRFLLIDEPTNHLDLTGRELVGRYLNRKKGFLLVSHDRAFLDSCVDHILSINRANIEIQRGNFSSWQANKQRRDAFEFAENEKLEKSAAKLAEAQRRASGWSAQVEKAKNGRLDSGLKPDKGHVGHQAAKLMKRAKSIEARREAELEEKSKLLRNVDFAEELKIHPMPYPKQVLAEAVNLEIRYGDRTVCGPVSFRIKSGDRLLLRGANGAGKSSILKLLEGEEVPHSGALNRGGGLVLSCVPQDCSGLSGSLSDFEREQNLDGSLFRAVLRKLDFSREQFEKDLFGYSEGQKKKVLLAASLCRSAHLYVWDEPLNYVDVLSRMQLETLIREFEPTMVLVEHDRAFQEAVVTQVIDL